MTRRALRRIGWAVSLIAIFSASIAHSFNFTPTEAEWQTWPEFCRARYSVTQFGKGAGYESRVSDATRALWADSLGTCWIGVHHYCAGLSQYGRAGSASGQKRKSLLSVAEGEHELYRGWCPKENPFWANNETHLAKVQAELGDVAAALLTLDGAIDAHPAYDAPYIELARLLSKMGRTKDAQDALLKGDTATAGNSAEIKYALGVLLYKQRRFEDSRKYARDAYALGYPLPWLKEKLAAVGFPL